MSEPIFVDLPFGTGRVKIEVAWVGDASSELPPLVFLHEGLGSLSLWRDFPARLCALSGRRGLVYSRPGYGRSTPRAPDEHWGVDFMHRQAHELLPALLQALGISRPLLIGHSDGGSIALLYAARFAVAGLAVLAPHVCVEAFSLSGIRQTRQAYLETDLRARLARHHADPDSAFWGWSDIWLAPDFARWNIEAEIAAVRAPLLAVQGADDEYGTLLHLHAIARRIAQTRLLVLPDCGHSPHKDQPDRLLRELAQFIRATAPAPQGDTR